MLPQLVVKSNGEGALTPFVQLGSAVRVQYCTVHIYTKKKGVAKRGE